jgi:hypothetical protein
MQLAFQRKNTLRSNLEIRLFLLVGKPRLLTSLKIANVFSTFWQKFPVSARKMEELPYFFTLQLPLVWR